MGRRLDSLLRRNFRTSKFKATVNLAASRLTVLRNQRQARCSVARSDVVQLLNHGQHERALLRVEQVVKEQNLLDVYLLIDGFCHLLIERVNLLEQEKDCPDELKEAISSLIYASTRCGDFPELLEIRTIFVSRFGREFVGRAVELRNNCGVNPKMIQKLSTRMPSLENRLQVLKEIASEENIVLQLQEVDSGDTQGKLHAPSHSGDQRMVGIGEGSTLPIPVKYEMVEGFSDSTEMTKKYKDVADAAQAAFRSAAFAAAAARAAVELSRSDAQDPQDPDDPNNPNLQPIANEDQKIGIGFEKIHPAQNYSSDSEDGEISVEDKAGKLKLGEKKSEFKKSPSSLSIESMENGGYENMPLGEEDLLRKLNEREIVFDESEDDSGGEIKMPYSSTPEHFPVTSKARLELEEPEKKSSFAEKIVTPGAGPYDDKYKKPISVRTRKTFDR